MPRDIRTTLAVDGEQAYKRAIQEASKSISQMGTQLSLATAQFKQDGDAMKLMETRSKTLRAEIDQQKAIVKSLEGAVKDMTEQYGENSKEAEKWQAELNRAQTKLINLQNELDNNDKGLDKNGRAFARDTQQAKGFGAELSALDKIQKSTTFQALNTALNNVEEGFKNALSKGKEFAGFVWDKAVESSNRYDELATDAKKIGVSVQELRAWQTAAEKIDTGIGDITKSMDKLVNPTDKVSEALRSLGVQYKEAFVDVESPGDIIVKQKSALDVFWEAIEAIGAMDDATKAEAATNELFGKSFRDLIPLIDAGRQKWDEEVAKALETAPDEGAAEKLTTFNDALVDFNRVLTDFQDTIMAGIAPGLTDLTNAGTQFLTELTKWAQSETGQAKLEELSGAISGLVSSLATEENFNAVVSAATGVVTGFTDAVGWIKTHQEETVIAIGAIGLAFGAIKIGSAVITTLSLINQIKWLDVAKGSSALAGIGGGSAATGAATNAATNAAAGASIANLLQNAFPTATAFVEKLFSGWGLTGLATLTGIPMIDFFKDPSKYMGNGKALETYNDLGIDPLAGSKTALTNPDAMRKGLWSLLGWDGENENPKPAGEPKRSRNVTGTATEDQMQGYVIDRTVESIYNDLYKAINDYDPNSNAMDTTQFFDNVLYPLIQDATGAGGVTGDAGDEIADQIYDKWIQSLFDEEWEGTTDGILNILQEAIEEAQSSAEPDAETAGKAVSEGLAAGIRDAIPEAAKAAGELGWTVNRVLRHALQIASPSKVTRSLGQFVGAGFAQGINDAIGAVQAATGRMAYAAAGGYGYGGMGRGFGGSTYSPNYSRTMNIQNYYQRSDADVDTLMDAMAAEAQAEREGRGA